MCDECKKAKKKLEEHIKNNDLGRVEDFMRAEYWNVIDNCKEKKIV